MWHVRKAQINYRTSVKQQSPLFPVLVCSWTGQEVVVNLLFTSLSWKAEEVKWCKHFQVQYTTHVKLYTTDLWFLVVSWYYIGHLTHFWEMSLLLFFPFPPIQHEQCELLWEPFCCHVATLTAKIPKLHLCDQISHEGHLSECWSLIWNS